MFETSLKRYPILSFWSNLIGGDKKKTASQFNKEEIAYLSSRLGNSVVVHPYFQLQ